MTVLETCAMGTILILVICAVRAAALNRLPRRTFVALWLLVAIRLLLPVQVTSPVSVYRLLPRPAAEYARQATTELRIEHASPQAGAAVSETASAEPAQTENGTQNPWTIVWWSGSTACAAVSIVMYVRLLHRFAQSVPADAQATRDFAKNHPLRRRLGIRVSDQVRAPLTYGILRPVILLPTSMDLSDTKELNYVLTHEYVHIRHIDALQKVLYTAVCCLYWWNPFVWIMYVLANRDIELACDEGVVARCGGPADYARMLIQLEEQKIAPIVPGMQGGAGAAKERIRSIMKLRKKSVLTLVVAGALVVGVGTAFATNAPQPQERGQIASVSEDTVVEQGTADGGGPVVEWWTAEEYEAWLAQERVDLQAMLGEKGWTPSLGEFVWTQEQIDEAIALYEDTLAQIRAGVRVSKTVDGSDDVMLMESGAVETASEDDALAMYDEHTYSLMQMDEERVDSVLRAEYERCGLTQDASGRFFWQGQPVRYFEDSVELEPGISASRITYLNDDGTVGLRTVRRPTPNGDGSVDPFGALERIEEIPKAELASMIADIKDRNVEVTATEEDIIRDADLAPYRQFGLSYEISENGLRMEYNGKPVHCLYDPVTHTWFANNMHGTDLADNRVDLEAVYQDGRLAGLKESPEAHQKTTATYVQEATALSGTSFEDIFDRYSTFGLYYERANTMSGGTGYNLFLNGRPLNKFSDVTPQGSAFSYESAEQRPDGVTAHVTYNGTERTGIVAD